MLLICALAWFKGDKPERAGALLLCAAWAGSFLLRGALAPFFDEHDQNVRTVTRLSVDFLLAAGLLILAIRYSSLWLGAVLMIQGAEMTLHSMFLGPDRSSLYTYIVVSNLFSFMFLGMILAGTVASWRRRIVKRRSPGAPSSRWALPLAAGDAAPPLSLAA